MIRTLQTAVGLLALAFAVLSANTTPAAEPQAQPGPGAPKAKAVSPAETPQELLADAGEAAAEEAHGREAHDSRGHAEPNILEFKPSLMVSTLIVFTLLLLILWRFAWGPLSVALAERERQQEETIRQAELARSESERLLAEHRKQMDETAEQVRKLLEEARRQSDANAQTILQKAQAEAEATRERADREIGSARDQALAEIWQKAADLAVSVAGKVLSRELSHDDQRRLVEVATHELPASPAGTNGHGGHIG